MYAVGRFWVTVDHGKENVYMDELFYSHTPSVESNRILYTPSAFARTSLCHLQEAGYLQAVHPHTSSRSNLVSYLFFVVLSGKGRLDYEGVTYELAAGDCVFIDCRKSYSHSTGEQLWALRWCHFYAASLPAIYEKYKERGGTPVFHPDNLDNYISILSNIQDIAASSDHVRDMRINERLNSLLTLLMEESWHPENGMLSRKRVNLSEIKAHLDEFYADKIVLDDLAERFFINKYYLTRIFKETYGTTITSYVQSVRITHAKQMLRFTDMSVDEIGRAVGMDGANYFSRIFQKVEGIRPSEYRKRW